jgi:peptide/nickel transport system permease protein
MSTAATASGPQEIGALNDAVEVSADRVVFGTLARLQPLALVGLGILLLAAFAALICPILPLRDPNLPNTSVRLSPPLTNGFLLGADELGRDILSRLMWGARVSLVAGLVATSLAMTAGVSIGLLSGLAGGWLDEALMRIADVVIAFPPLLLAIGVVAMLGPSLLNAMAAVAFVSYPFYARLVRAEVLSIREREFVVAGRALGVPSWYLAWRHILPNVIPTIVVAASLDLGTKIVVTASLSFLGLGSQPPTADWGTMLATAKQVITLAPHVELFPGLAIFLVVVAANLLGDGLREALDPTAK